MARPVQFDQLIATWLRHAEFQRSEDFWAWEQAHEIVRHDPHGGWSLVEALFARAPRLLLQNLAAGPLAKLLIHHGAVVVERVEALAAREPAFRECPGWAPLASDEVPPWLGERLVRASGGSLEILEWTEQDAEADSASHDPRSRNRKPS
jgi:hypothetical protein